VHSPDNKKPNKRGAGGGRQTEASKKKKKQKKKKKTLSSRKERKDLQSNQESRRCVWRGVTGKKPNEVEVEKLSKKHWSVVKKGMTCAIWGKKGMPGKGEEGQQSKEVRTIDSGVGGRGVPNVIAFKVTSGRGKIRHQQGKTKRSRQRGRRDKRKL